MARDRYDRRILVANPERRIGETWLSSRPRLPSPGISLRFHLAFRLFRQPAHLTRSRLGHGREAEWQSMLVGVSVLKVMGLKPIPETAAQRRVCATGCRALLPPPRNHAWHANSVQSPPNPLPAGRSFHWARRYSPERAKPLAQAIFAAYWTEGRDIGDLGTVLDIAEQSGLDRSALADAHASGEALGPAQGGRRPVAWEGCVRLAFLHRRRRAVFFGVEKMELMEEWGWRPAAGKAAPLRRDEVEGRKESRDMCSLTMRRLRSSSSGAKGDLHPAQAQLLLAGNAEAGCPSGRKFSPVAASAHVPTARRRKAG